VAILKRRRRRAGVAVLVLLIVAAMQPARAQPGLEYEVKAAFLYNFIKFVEWPPESLAAGEPFRVCLLGEDPFGGALERAVRGDDVGGRPIAVERVAIDGALAACHLVFVPRAHANRTAATVRAIGNGAVLMVGESDGFLQAGGAINLVVDGGHVRFDVAIPQAAARRLKISSKLLRVARNVSTSARQDR
jgi:hypothetical protein